MIDAYNATYASVSYLSQTTSLSFSSQQSQTVKDSAKDSAPSNDGFSFSLGYTSTTTVETFTLVLVQELGNSNDINDNSAKQGQDEKSALQTVLEGPKDPFNPLEGALASFYSGKNDDDDHSGKGHGHKHGHDVRNNNYGHTKNDIQAAYSFSQVQVSTTTSELSLSLQV